MLDGPMIFRCHCFVPVWYWPVLWLYLARLEATAAMCRAEGRKGFAWHLERNGVIWVSHMDASDAERAQREELPQEFNRTPWTRALPLGETALWAALSHVAFSRLNARLDGMAKTILELDGDHTAATPCAAPARPP